MKFISTIAALFLALLIFTSGGYLFVFKLKQYQLRQNVMERIEKGLTDDELTLLKIPQKLIERRNNLFEWEEDGREFRYWGEMYDLVRQEQHEDTLYFYCIHDHEESALYAQLDQLMEQETDSGKKKHSGQFSRFFSFVYLSETWNYHPPINSATTYFRGYTFSVAAWLQAPDSPPPQV